MDVKLICLTVLFVIGAFFMGRAITGYTIMSQTCCFPSENCAPEKMCEATNPEFETDIGYNYFFAILGTFLIILSISLIHNHIRKRGIK